MILRQVSSQLYQPTGTELGKNKDAKKLEDRLETVENEFEKKCEKISKLESDLKDTYLKITEKDHTISKINKKLNVLKEKVTLLFDLEAKIEILEKKVDIIGKKEFEVDTNDKESQSLPEACSNNSEEIKCEVCDFTAKNKFVSFQKDAGDTIMKKNVKN